MSPKIDLIGNTRDWNRWFLPIFYYMCETDGNAKLAQSAYLLAGDLESNILLQITR